jgi:predicted ArsR family transcriptional regulator
LYEATSLARRELGQNYAELATLLWDQMQRIEDEPTREQLLGRIRKAMVEQFRDRVTGASPETRLTELANALAERGFQVEAARRGDNPLDLPVLREHTCPYHEIASRDTSICELEQAVFAEVVGSPLELTHCCQRGDRMCEFGAQPIPKSEMELLPVRV